jgi:hypothetical protein
MKFVTIEGDFKYLVKMPMDSVTQENVANIMKEKENTEDELKILKGTTLEKMWLSELDILETQYDVYKKQRETLQIGGVNSKDNNKKQKNVKSKK